jgi:hypothetical protein
MLEMEQSSASSRSIDEATGADVVDSQLAKNWAMQLLAGILLRVLRSLR